MSELTTPEQALTYFVKNAKAGDYDKAAFVLNLGGLNPENQRSAGPDLARQLYLVMERKTGFPFGKLPDRVDGYVPPLPPQQTGTEDRYKQTFLLDTQDLEVGQFEIYLTRYSTDDIPSAWLFSPATVGEIEEAFQQLGPRSWENKLPEWMVRIKLINTPLWAWALLIISLLTSLMVTKLLLDALQKFLDFGLVKEIRKGLAVLLTTTVPYVLMNGWTPVPSVILDMLFFCGFCAFVFIISNTLNYFSVRLIRGEIDSVEDLDGVGRREDKKTLTYLSVGRRLLSFLVLTFGLGFLALNTPKFETLGVGMLASAGVLSVLLGAAAQPVVGNFISGLQIGLTRPVRVGDSIIYEGTWCYVEDITFMYVLCRTWDEMRLVIPLRHFTSNPFKSDSLSDPKAMRTLEMPLDYSVDIDALRAKYLEIAEASELWDKDGREPELEVIAFDDETVVVRAIAWSKNASSAWRLHCEIREKLLRYLQSEQPQSLPRRRYLKVEEDETADKRR